MVGNTPVVLVVEDEEHLADLHAQWLRDAYDVRTAYTAERALDALGPSVDVVLLDRHLPDRHGDEVLERVRDRGLDCRVAMVTAVEPDVAVLELGFDAYLTKPVTETDVEEVVDRLLTRAAYNEQLREFYSLVERRAALEAAMDASELASCDRYEELTERIERQRERVDPTAMELTDGDLPGVVHDLESYGDETAPERV